VNVSHKLRPVDPDDAEKLGHGGRIFVMGVEDKTSEISFAMFATAGLNIETLRFGDGLLEDYRPDTDACLILRIQLASERDFALVSRLRRTMPCLPVIVVSDSDVIADAVRFMKAGAAEFLEAPVSSIVLLDSIELAMAQSRAARETGGERRDARDHLAHLTPRQHGIMALVLAGAPSKNIAADLHISQRTVENHRAAIMHKTGCRSLPALARLVLAAAAARPVNGAEVAAAA
jgi:two-component system CheB/CheR fusion protein